MIDSTKAAKLRDKTRRGVNLSPANRKALDEYDAARAASKAAKSPPPDAAPPVEGEPAQAEGQPAEAPPPNESPEAPPVVKVETQSAGGSGEAWQAKYKKTAASAGGMDGREMLCTFIGSQWRDALKAMEADLALVGVAPVIPADSLYPVIVIALDQLLPDKARLTPPIAAAVATTITTGQRFRHHKKIVEAQKHDPSIQEYKRKAEEAEKAARAERVAKAAQDGIKSVPADPPPVQTASAPIDPIEPTLGSTPSSKATEPPRKQSDDLVF